LAVKAGTVLEKASANGALFKDDAQTQPIDLKSGGADLPKGGTYPAAGTNSPVLHVDSHTCYQWFLKDLVYPLNSTGVKTSNTAKDPDGSIHVLATMQIYQCDKANNDKPTSAKSNLSTVVYKSDHTYTVSGSDDKAIFQSLAGRYSTYN
jgi:hypothetical protein